MNKHGKLLFKYGTMSSGKSLHLIATAHNFQEHDIPYIIIKSKIDTRDGEGVIHSRALGDIECVTVSLEDNIHSIISNYLDSMYYAGYEIPKWILVDEAQFLTSKQVEQLSAIADKYGLDIKDVEERAKLGYKTLTLKPIAKTFSITVDMAEAALKNNMQCFCADVASLWQPL